MIECLSVVSTTPVKKCLAVSLIPVNGFLAVSLTLAINFRLFDFFDGYQCHRGKMLLPVSMIPAINSCDNREVGVGCYRHEKVHL